MKKPTKKPNWYNKLAQTPAELKIFSHIKEKNSEALAGCLSKNIRRDIVNNDGESPVHAAISSPEMIEILARHGFSVETMDSYGYRPLHKTILYSFPASLDTLVELGANINGYASWKDTPVILAAEFDRVNFVDQLLKRGAKPDLRDNNGETALMISAAAGRMAIVQCLLSYGAKPHLINKDGKTAMDIARRFGHTKVEALIEKHLLMNDFIKDENDDNEVQESIFSL